MSGWLIGGGAVAGLALVGGAYAHGVGVGRDRERAAQARALGKLEERSVRLQHASDRDQARAAVLEGQRQQTVREIYREVPRIVDRDVYRTVCIDADGVQLLDRAAAAANAATGPVAAVTAAGAADVAPER